MDRRHYCKCLVCGVRENVKKKGCGLTKFYNLPQNEIKKNKWLTSINRSELINQKLSQDFKVCARHFMPHMINPANKRLRRIAVPHAIKEETKTESTDQEHLNNSEMFEASNEQMVIYTVVERVEPLLAAKSEHNPFGEGTSQMVTTVDTVGLEALRKENEDLNSQVKNLQGKEEALKNQMKCYQCKEKDWENQMKSYQCKQKDWENQVKSYQYKEKYWKNQIKYFQCKEKDWENQMKYFERKEQELEDQVNHFQDMFESSDFNVMTTIKRDLDDDENESPIPMKIAKHDNINEDSSSSDTKSLQDVVNIGKRSMSLLEGEFFDVVEEIPGSDFRGAQVRVRCNVCHDKRILKGTLGVTSNFIKHLRTKHPCSYNAYTQSKTPRRIFNKSREPIRKFAGFDLKILKFIVSTMSPISIVENQAFKDLFDEHAHVMLNYDTISTKLNFFHSSIESSLKSQIATSSHVCITVDVWPQNGYYLFGMTCHWLDCNWQRNSVVLVCSICSGNNSYESIKKKIECVTTNFDLNSKIVATIIKNQFNFSNIFRKLGIHCEGLPIERHQEESSKLYSISSNNAQKHNFESPLMGKGFTENVNSSFWQCSSYILNAIALEEFSNFLENDANLKTTFSMIFEKCSKLWAKADDGKSAEIMINAMGSILRFPRTNKFNELYNAINNLITNQQQLNIACSKLNTPGFEDSDLICLNEFILVMKPIADALDFLQQDQTCYYGYLIPTLVTIKVKFEKLEKSERISVLKNCLRFIKKKFESKFEHIFLLKPSAKYAMIAAVVCPQIKLRWLSALQTPTSNVEVKEIHDIIVELVEEFSLNNNHTSDITVQKVDPSESFFDFNESAEIPLLDKTTNAGIEYYNYLKDTRTDFKILNEYPSIRGIFEKYNTPLPSSAPVEKLFSDIKDVPKPANLASEYVERLLFLKANYQLIDKFDRICNI